MTAPARVAGLDIGATKAHLRAVELGTGRVLLDEVVPTDGWAHRTDEQRAAELGRLAAAHFAPIGDLQAVVAGVHGSDSPRQQALLEAGLRSATGRALVLNDAELLVPAAGLQAGVGVIAGTGSVASARLSTAVVGGAGSTSASAATTATATVGGWGWVLGDEGGAVGLVRDAAKEVLRGHDEGTSDLLGPELMAALGVAHPHALGHRFSANDPREWSSAAEAVFRAESLGSPSAARVVEAHLSALVHLVTLLWARGADPSAVAAGGGVFVGQPRFYSRFAEAVAVASGGTATVRLVTEPVGGAIAIARALAESPANGTRVEAGATQGAPAGRADAEASS